MANSEAKKEANKRYRATTRKVNKIRMQITIEQHAEIKAIAAQKNTTMVQIINELIKVMH
ncbi:MAG: hypothetical protein LW807_07015 [Proteobacteria bacterium]|jgi:hypothetical protein|nr:hypothetical protein [Pseudomonadota bacterium]